MTAIGKDAKVTITFTEFYCKDCGSVLNVTYGDRPEVEPCEACIESAVDDALYFESKSTNERG